jgi:phosphatidylglycerol:prolipoprotein diacylglycerol transferase
MQYAIVDSTLQAATQFASVDLEPWVNDLDPIAIEFWRIKIRWYALAYIVGLLAAWKIALRLSKEPKSPFDEDDANDFPTWALVGLMLGARLGYVIFYKPQYYLNNITEIPAIWQGGMSFHGGLLGIFLAAIIFARKRNIPLGALTDYVVLVAPIGLFLGRIANFVNGELWGRPTDHAVGVIFPNAPDLQPRHPSQLYEALLEGLVTFTILWLLRGRTKRFNHGVLSGTFLALYGTFRFGIEFVRQPDQHLGLIVGDLSMGQLLCAPMIIAGGIVVWRSIQTTRPVSKTEVEASPGSADDEAPPSSDDSPQG